VHLPSPRPFGLTRTVQKYVGYGTKQSGTLVHLWEVYMVRNRLVCRACGFWGGVLNGFMPGIRVSRIQGPQASLSWRHTICPDVRQAATSTGSFWVRKWWLSHLQQQAFVVRNGEQVASYELIRYASLLEPCLWGVGSCFGFLCGSRPRGYYDLCRFGLGFRGGYESIGFHMLGQTPPLDLW
jgi:hypothetical protein